MKRFYLPIRAFGDFIITASVVKDNFLKRIPTILPIYFEEIFHAIDAGRFFDVQGGNAYRNQPAFFELYKMKDFKNLKRLVNDIRVFSATVNEVDQYVVDYSSRRLGFVGANLIWPDKALNVYDGRIKLFAELGITTPGGSTTNSISPFKSSSMRRVLILPDSRIAIKSIDQELVNSIVNEFSTFDISIGHFSNENTARGKCLYYSSFKELIALISAYDLIICAESLPYHLANYLKKPHIVIYNQSRHFNSTFMTPFMTAYKYYSFFTKDNAKSVMTDLDTILLGNSQ